jgi:tRNA nucleotidyltransferase (CCA-adding enzyme)
VGELIDAGLLPLIPADVRDISERLRSAGHRSWIVGGCTRDLLLGRPVNDWDLATDASPAQVQQLFRRVVPTGIQHGTVTVMRGPRGYEVTTLRGEGAYSDGRHPDTVRFVDDLAEDLARRDFTVNAIALDPLSGELTDPFGGRSDLALRVLRAVGEPDRRFSEDGLRLMRAARFRAVLQFDIAPDTLQAMAAQARMLEKISAERVRDELLKTLQAPVPSMGLQIMLQAGMLDVVLAELRPMVGCEQNHYHRYDVWTHTLGVVDACQADPVLRLAALLHDVGKPAVRQLSEKTGDYTFYGHEVVGARAAAKICERLRLSNQHAERVVHLIRHHLVVYDESWTDAAVRRWLNRVGAERAGEVLDLAVADAAGKGMDTTEQVARIEQLRARMAKLLEEGLALSVRDLVIDGNDLMKELGLAPGRTIGVLLQRLLEAVLDDPAVNTREALLELAAGWLREPGEPGAA